MKTKTPHAPTPAALQVAAHLVNTFSFEGGHPYADMKNIAGFAAPFVKKMAKRAIRAVKSGKCVIPAAELAIVESIAAAK